MRLRKFILPALVSLLLAVSGVSFFPKNKSFALSGSDFKAGKIISDSKFYSDSALTADQIQSFLNAKVPDCDTNGQQLIYDSRYGDTVTRKKYSERRGVSTPFICLKDYSQSTPNVSANEQCSSYQGGTKSAANIINGISKACRISQKVLLVLLQKEQSLVTDDWPWPVQYKKATGYGCPDTAPCDSQYYGFFNQVYNAARQYNRYKQNPGDYGHIPFRTNSVRYHPNSSCGSKSVTIRDFATAGLYNYTPYTPNSAALDNLYGSGNSCSAYGNRNFWRMYSDWFGSTLGDSAFEKLDQPRWMQLSADSHKVYVPAVEDDDEIFTAGTQMYFQSKITIEGITYLRTKSDTENNIERGIPLSDVEDIDIAYENMATPRWMELTRDKYERHPVTEKITGNLLDAGHEIFFDTKIQINGRWLLRSSYATAWGMDRVIPIDDLKSIDLRYYKMAKPRWMATTADLYKQVTDTAADSGSLIPEGTALKLKDKIRVGGLLYLRTETDSVNGLDLVIPYSKLKGLRYQRLAEPRKMKLAVNTYKKLPYTGADFQPQYNQGLKISFSTKIYVNGQWYLRTSHDTEKSIDRGFLLSELSDL